MQLTPEITCQLCEVSQPNPLGYLTIKEQLHIADHLDAFEAINDIEHIKELFPSLKDNEVDFLSTCVCDNCRDKL